MKKILIVFVIAFISACSSDKKLTKEEQEMYMEKGMHIVQNSFDLLSSNLMEQMKQGGPNQAVPFCNIQALPLTAIIALQEDVELKRVSKLYRNEANKPNAEALRVISNYEEMLKKEEKLSPILLNQSSGKPHFYAPIIINKKCLSCHGDVGKQISKATDSLIKTVYPNDLATGYKIGDLRGVWSIQF